MNRHAQNVLLGGQVTSKEYLSVRNICLSIGTPKTCCSAAHTQRKRPATTAPGPATPIPIRVCEREHLLAPLPVQRV